MSRCYWVNVQWAKHTGPNRNRRSARNKFFKWALQAVALSEELMFPFSMFLWSLTCSVHFIIELFILHIVHLKETQLVHSWCKSLLYFKQPLHISCFFPCVFSPQLHKWGIISRELEEALYKPISVCYKMKYLSSFSSNHVCSITVP